MSISNILNLKFGIKSTHKPSVTGNYRELVDLQKIDACNVIENIDKFPMFNDQVAFLNESFPGLIHKCPYKVSEKLF